MSGFFPQFSQKNNNADKKVNYMNLPCPFPFEEINLEAASALNPGLFEGLKIDLPKELNPKFTCFHSLSLSSEEVPTRSSEVVKSPVSNWGFAAVYNEPKWRLIGRLLPGGNVLGIISGEFSDNLASRAEILCAHEMHMSWGKATIDYKGTDYRAMFLFGTSSIEASYIQDNIENITGWSHFLAWSRKKIGVIISGRYESDNWIGTAQLVHTQVLASDVVRKISDKASFATEFRYNHLSKESVASVGYDFVFRESRVRGKLDSNGCAGALQEQAIMGGGLKLLLSTEIDHGRKDHKFRIGIQR